MTQNNQLATRADRIGARIDQGIVAGIGMSPQRGMQVETMGQALEVAKLMSLSGCAVPPHLRENPGACLAIAIQSYEWSINPFALANKSYSVSDRLAYEAALYSAVVQRRAPIKGRIKYDYAGDGVTRTCTVSAELADGSGSVSYTSPKFSTIQPKNSPLWKNDPDQQMAYYSVRAFARRHFSDTMMGIATVDELMDSPVPVVSMQQVPGESRTTTLLNKVSSRPVSEGQTMEPTPEALQEAESDSHSHPDQLRNAESESASDPACSTGAHPAAGAVADQSPARQPTCREFAFAMGHDQAKTMGIPLTDEPLADFITRRDAAKPTHTAPISPTVVTEAEKTMDAGTAEVSRPLPGVMSHEGLMDAMGGLAQDANVPEPVMHQWIKLHVRGDIAKIAPKRRAEVLAAWKAEVAGMPK